MNALERDVILAPQTMKGRILRAFYDSVTAVHMGISRTLAHIKQYFIWKNMDKDIREFIKNCVSCQQRILLIHATEEKYFLLSNKNIYCS
jgi:phage terminase small subunit